MKENIMTDVQTDQSIIDDILNVFGKAESIVITAHEFPDGDAVGSSLALFFFLHRLGKDVRVVLPLRQIGVGSILEGARNIVDTEDFDFSRHPDLLCCLDCSDPSRICDVHFSEWIQDRCPCVNIDHHGKQLFGNWNYVIKDFSSTGELVYQIAKHAGWSLDRLIAEALWMSLVTDTNRFSKQTCTPNTLRYAADLAGNGARVGMLNDLIYEQDSWNNIQLRRKVYNSLKLLCNGSVALASLERRDFEETSCLKQDAAEFPLIPFGIQGVKVAALIYLPPDSAKVRISLRSRSSSLPCAKTVAEHFGGSGHEDSAGAAVNGTVIDICAEFCSYMEKICADLKNGKEND